MRKYKPEYLVHLATETHVDRSIDNSKDFIKSNILGTYNLLLASQKYLKIIKKFKLLLMGTDEIFGDMAIKSKKVLLKKAVLTPIIHTQLPKHQQ